MTEQEQTEKMSNTQSSSLKNTIGISVIIIIAAIGIGMIIRGFQTNSTEQKIVAQNDDEAPSISENQQTPVIIYDIPQEVIPPEPEEIVVPEPAPEPVQEEPPANTSENNNSQEYYRSQRMQDMVQWLSWFSNLSQEDQAILAQGVRNMIFSLIQRWQYMPPEQAQAERQQLEQMFQGWQDLPPEEREQGIQMMQIQMEQWLNSNQQY